MRLPENIPLYEGKLNPEWARKNDLKVFHAYQSWKAQRARCNCPTNKSYKYYGAMGIEVEYPSREYVSWWLHEYDKKPAWIWPNVDRIDHNKNYSFDNVRLVEGSENTKERNKRVGVHRPNIKPVKIFKNGKLVKITESEREARRLTGIEGVHRYCNGFLKKSREGYHFEYVKK